MPRYKVTVGDREYSVELKREGERLSVSIDGQASEVVSHRLGESRSLLLIDNRSQEIDIRPNGEHGSRLVFMQGMEIPVSIEDYRIAELRRTAGMAAGGGQDMTLKAPMPGLVLDVRVTEGQQVKRGEPLLVIEAMKMENIIKAKSDVSVKSIAVSNGQSVEKGALLMEFE